MDITIESEFEFLLPAMAKEEKQKLRESLELEGCRDPLVLWGDILVDGHNRYRLCMELGIPFRTVDRAFLDRNAVKLWILENQLTRRNLSDLDRIDAVMNIEFFIAVKAKENQSRSEGRGKKGCQNSDNLIDTKQEAAALAGVSHDTYAKGKKVLEKGTPKLKQAVREKKASIDAAAQVASLPQAEQDEVVAKGEEEIIAKAK